MTVGSHALVGGAQLVEAHDPGARGVCASVDPFERLGVDRVRTADLKRRSGKWRAVQQRLEDEALLIRIGMYDQRMVVGIEGVEPVGEGDPLAVGVGVLLTEVPDDAEMVAEARHELSEVHRSLDSQGAVVEELIVLLFLRHDVHGDSKAIHVGEDSLPLAELAHVVAVLAVGRDPGVDIASVASDVHGQEVGGIHSLGREVVEGADQTLAEVSSPDRVAAAPIPDMGGIAVEAVGQAGAAATVIDRVVEVRVGEEILR